MLMTMSHLLWPKQTPTVFHEDVNHAVFEVVFNDVLVGLHHVGAEDLLVATFGHVGSGCSSVSFQHVGAASLVRKLEMSVVRIGNAPL